MTRLQCYERLVRRMRQRIFDYDDTPKETQATRVLHKAMAIQAKLLKLLPPPPTDQWGATQEDRRALARHGIAWGD